MKKLKIEWTESVHFGTSIVSMGRELHVDITGEAREWFVYGLETDADPVGLAESLKGGLHHAIGCFRSQARAVREAEKYVRQWLRERARAAMPRPRALSDDEPDTAEMVPVVLDDASFN